MKGVGCLNSHLTIFVHWFNNKGKSLWLLIHFLNAGYIIVSLVGLTAIGSYKSVLPAFVTQATSGAKPSTCSFSVFKAFSLTNIGK